MNKTNKILVGALVAQLALTVLVYTHGHGPSGVRTARAVVPGLDASAVTKVEIYGARGKGDDETVALRLRKQGADWVIDNRHGYPADSASVGALLSSVAAMTARGPATTGKGPLDQMQLADDHYAGKLVLTTPKGDQTLYIGKETGFQQRAVRLGKATDSYTVPDLSASATQTQVSDWIDPVYLELAADDITGLTIERGGQTLSLARGDDGSWQLAGAAAPAAAGAAAAPALDKTKVGKLVDAARKIEIADIAGIAGDSDASFGLDAPRAHITLAVKSKDGDASDQAYVIDIGAAVGGNSYVHLGSNRFVVTEAASKLQPILDASADSLAPSPPAKATPQAASGAGAQSKHHG